MSTYAEHVAAIARAGYVAYFAGRHVTPWDDLTSGIDTHRWSMAAEAVATTSHMAPREIRETYQEGIFDKEWGQLSAEYKGRWIRVSVAMERAKANAEAALEAAA